MGQFIPDQIRGWMHRNWGAFLIAIWVAFWGGVWIRQFQYGGNFDLIGGCIILLPFGFLNNLMLFIANIWPQGPVFSLFILGFIVGWIFIRLWHWKKWMPYILMAALVLNSFGFLIWLLGQFTLD